MPLPLALHDTTVKDILITGATHLRIYTIKNSTATFQLIVYYHFVSWAIENITMYDASAQRLCEQVVTIVISAENLKGREKNFLSYTAFLLILTKGL